MTFVELKKFHNNPYFPNCVVFLSGSLKVSSQTKHENILVLLIFQLNFYGTVDGIGTAFEHLKLSHCALNENEVILFSVKECKQACKRSKEKILAPIFPENVCK